MSRSLYIIGAPGTGKSTLMREIVRHMGLSFAPDEKVFRELWVNPLVDEEGTRRGISFGKERGAFSGTDALSMSVQPRALEWMAQTPAPEIVVGEGTRLSSPGFLVQLDRWAPLTVVYLGAPPELLEERRAEREGDTLSPRFVKQATTRAAAAAEAMRALGYPVLSYTTAYAAPGFLAGRVLQQLRGLSRN